MEIITNTQEFNECLNSGCTKGELGATTARMQFPANTNVLLCDAYSDGVSELERVAREAGRSLHLR